MKNQILTNQDIKTSFIDWVTDYYAHMGHFPGSFVYIDAALSPESEIDFPEDQIWEAIERLFPNGLNND